MRYILLNRKNSYPFICLLIIGLFLSCQSERDKRLHRALISAGENRVELEKVLSYYKEDTLKRKAAEYLIANMPYHYTIDTYLESPSGEKLIVDVAQFKDRGEVYWYLDSLYKIGYQLRSEKYEDIRTLKADFLIRNIDAAFRMWRKPWAKDVPFDVFCRWILPYRSQNEYIPIDLREKMINRYLPMLDSAKVVTPLEACRLINERFAEEFYFRDMMSPHYPMMEMTLKNGYDACIGLCNLSVFIMRSLGIPTTCDHTTWTHMNMGHLWNVVYDSGKTYPYDNENEYFINYPIYLREEEVRRPAKVYRFYFDQERVKGLEELEDVTDQYLTKCYDIEVPVDMECMDGSGLVYLCTYNCRQWMPLAIGKKDGDICRFKNVAGNNFFIVADSPDGRSLRFVTAPFYADTTGLVKKFVPHKNLVSHEFSITGMKLYSSLYLNYWDVDSSKFVKVDYDQLNDSVRIYNRIPHNSLLVFLIPKDKPFADRNRPLFYIEKDSIFSTRSDLSR